MTTVNLSDLEAAVRLAKDQGKAKIELHLFVVANLLAEYRRLTIRKIFLPSTPQQ